MKKLMILILSAAMVLCLAACGGNNEPTGTETPGISGNPNEPSFTFTYQGTEIALHAPAEPIITALGEPKSYSESTSCAFEGLDKTYGDGSFYIQTYPIGDKDYIYGWWFVDDLVSNDEDISIGSTLAEVDAMYGIENYNGSNAFQIKKGSGMLTIILENDVVTSVQYTIITE